MWVMYERAGLGRDAGGETLRRMDSLRSGGDTIKGGDVGSKRGLR